MTPSDRADSQQLLTRLVQTLQTSRRLILIDSLEELLQGNEKEGWSEFNDEAFLRCFQRVLSVEACQSRRILTSQELPTPLLEVGRYTLRQHALIHRVSLDHLKELAPA